MDRFIGESIFDKSGVERDYVIEYTVIPAERDGVYTPGHSAYVEIHSIKVETLANDFVQVSNSEFIELFGLKELKNARDRILDVYEAARRYDSEVGE